ncbi:hypothetical protein ACFL1C_02935 [Pseudomonadota bacterium]
MIRQLATYPLRAGKKQARRLINHVLIKKRVSEFSSAEEDIWDRVGKASSRAMDFLEARNFHRDDAMDKRHEYRYSAGSTRPTLYSSAYACMITSLLGKFSSSDGREKQGWLAHFDAHQNSNDGSFFDPVVNNEHFADSDWWGGRHLALHMISAYTALGEVPRTPFGFLEQYYDINRTRNWLDACDWSSSIGHEDDIDNKIMNIACLMQYQRDQWDDEKAAKAVDFFQDYLLEKINPGTGMWGKWDTSNPHHLSRMVQFAYHLYPLFLYDGKDLPNMNEVISLTLQTQNRYGGFGAYSNSSACEDIDSIDILCRFGHLEPSRKQEIDKTLMTAAEWVLCNQVEDGGFVFRLHEPLVYGHQEMASGRNEGALFPTWFRLLSLAYLARYFGQEQFVINRAPGLEF